MGGRRLGSQVVGPASSSGGALPARLVLQVIPQHIPLPAASSASWREGALAFPLPSAVLSRSPPKYHFLAPFVSPALQREGEEVEGADGGPGRANVSLTSRQDPSSG